MQRRMGNSSSQVVATQDDVPGTSQASTHIPGPDGAQDEKQPARKRVASTVDAQVEDTAKSAKRARTKEGTRGQRKGVPQHLRGHAIQPSQEIPAMPEEEVQADAGADQEQPQWSVEHEERDVVEELAMSPPTARNTKPLEQMKRQRRKRRLPGQVNDVEHAPAEENVPAGALDDIDANTVQQVEAAPPQQRQPKRKDNPLERLQRDAEDFAPELESTPKPKQRSKPTNRPAEGELDGEAVTAEAAAPKSKTKRKKAAKVAGEDSKSDQASVSMPKKASRKALKTPFTAPVASVEHEGDKGERRSAAEEGAEASDASEEPQLLDSIPTPPESPDAPVPVAAGTEERSADGDRGAHRDVDDGEPLKAPIPTSKLPKPTESKKRKPVDKEAQRAGGEHRFGQADSSDRDDALEVSKRPSKSRKHEEVKVAHEDDPRGDDDEDYQEHDGNDDAESHASNYTEMRAHTSKSKASKKQDKVTKVSGESSSKGERGQIQGMWSKEERALADEIFADVCRVAAVPDWELKANIIDWKNPTPHLKQLREELNEAFPKRTLKSIMRFCQRRYNAYQRGNWTEEDDQALLEAYELMPDRWTDISDSVGRFWEDCRMRWRDILSRPAKAETGPWSQDEESRLAKAVKECRDVILKDSEYREIRDQPEKVDVLINWKVVSEKMDGKRNAKRCREKWAKIVRLHLSEDVAPKATQPIQSKYNRPSAREREAERDYERCEAGDVYDIMCEICSAVSDTDKIFEHETTFWSIVAVRNHGSRFSSALRRKALQVAVDEYPCKAVLEAETLAGKAKGVKARMEVLGRKGSVEFPRSFTAEAKAVKKISTGGEVVKKQKNKKQAKGMSETAAEEEILLSSQQLRQDADKNGKPKAKRNYKSAELVVESDDDDEDVQVERTQSEEPASEDEPATSEDPGTGDDEGDESAEVDRDMRARPQTEELQSLGSPHAVRSPSTFLEHLQGGKKKDGGKGGGRKAREGIKT